MKQILCVRRARRRVCGCRDRDLRMLLGIIERLSNRSCSEYWRCGGQWSLGSLSGPITWTSWSLFCFVYGFILINLYNDHDQDPPNTLNKIFMESKFF